VEDNIKMGIVEIWFNDVESTVWTSERRASRLLCLNLGRLTYFVVLPVCSVRYVQLVTLAAANSKWSGSNRETCGSVDMQQCDSNCGTYTW